jgi:hypothetical protein
VAQLTGIASVGVLTGEKLDSIPMIPVAWRDFRDSHPDAWVLSRDTGHNRDYGRNPYVGYDLPETGLLFHTDPGDDRLELKARILALEGDDEVVAVDRDAVADAGVFEFTLDGADLVAWYVPGQASALESDRVSGGRDIGSVAVYRPVAAGRQLGFTADGEQFTDDQTGTTWNILGEAVDGPLVHLSRHRTSPDVTSSRLCNAFSRCRPDQIPSTRDAQRVDGHSDEPLDRGLGRQFAGCREGVQAIAG